MPFCRHLVALSRTVRPFAVILGIISLAACGRGGGGPSSGGSPTPSGSFTLNFTANSVDLVQGGDESFEVQIFDQGGFSGSVDVSVSGLPTGVTVNPATLSINSTGSLKFSASKTAPTGSTQIIVHGISGSLQTHTGLSLNVSKVATPVSRPFLPTGGSIDRAFFDPTRQLLFAPNQSLNELDVISASDFSVQTRVPLPQPFGIDQMPDGHTLVIGTYTQAIYTVDEDTLTSTAHLSPNFPSVVNSTAALLVPVAMGNGKVLILAQDLGIYLSYVFGGQHILEWDSTSDTFTESTQFGSAATHVIPNLTRSADHLWALAGIAGTLYLYSSASDTFAQFSGPAGVRDYALNPDGSQLAVATGSNVSFFNQQGTELGTSATNAIFNYAHMQYSSDGNRVYVEVFPSPYASVVDVVSAQTFAQLGTVTSAYGEIQLEPILLAVDPSNRSFLFTSGGVALLDCSNPRSGSSTVGNNAVPNPNSAPLNSSPQISFQLTTYPAGTAITFGGKMAPIVSNGPNNNPVIVQLPPSSQPGPVDVVLTLPDGETLVEPQAFSYGLTFSPPAQSLVPATHTPSIEGFGFGFIDEQGSFPEVTVAGHDASNVTAVAGPATTAMDEIAFQPPSGSGSATVSMANGLGSSTLNNAFTYLPSTVIVPATDLTRLLYDSSRNVVYGLTKTQVDVFNVSTNQFQTPILPGGIGGQSYIGMAMTPDHSKLLLTDSAASSLTIVNPDNQAQSTSVNLGQSPGPSLAVTNTGKVFLQMAIVNPMEFDLSAMTSTSRNDLSIDVIFAATPDGSHIVAANEDTSGTVYQWDSTNDSFASQSLTDGLWDDLAIKPDGSAFAAIYGSASMAGEFAAFFDSALHYVNRNVYPDFAPVDEPQALGAAFTSTGATLVVSTETSIDITDTASGRLRGRIATPEPLPSVVDGFSVRGVLALDTAGQTIYAISQSGLTVFHLPIPLDQVTPPAWPSVARAGSKSRLSNRLGPPSGRHGNLNNKMKAHQVRTWDE